MTNTDHPAAGSSGVQRMPLIKSLVEDLQRETARYENTSIPEDIHENASRLAKAKTTLLGAIQEALAAAPSPPSPAATVLTPEAIETHRETYYRAKARGASTHGALTLALTAAIPHMRPTAETEGR